MCLHPRMIYSYISLENNFLSYDYITYMWDGTLSNSRLVRSREFCAMDTIMTNFRTLKKSIIDTSSTCKWSTLPLALQWPFYLLLRTDR